VVPALPEPAEEDLVIEGAAAAPWRALGEAQRSGIAAFLGGAQRPGAVYDVRSDGPLPEDFARDLARGGPILRDAFPDLARRVVGVDRTEDPTVVRVACEGQQRGAFFRILSPSGRRVTFEVVHTVLVGAGRIVEHRVAIDVRAIVRQLSSQLERRSPSHG
jgi:hypothetical protein